MIRVIFTNIMFKNATLLSTDAPVFDSILIQETVLENLS